MLTVHRPELLTKRSKVTVFSRASGWLAAPALAMLGALRSLCCCCCSDTSSDAHTADLEAPLHSSSSPILPPSSGPTLNSTSTSTTTHNMVSPGLPRVGGMTDRRSGSRQGDDLTQPLLLDVDDAAATAPTSASGSSGSQTAAQLQLLQDALPSLRQQLQHQGSGSSSTASVKGRSQTHSLECKRPHQIRAMNPDFAAAPAPGVASLHSIADAAAPATGSYFEHSMSSIAAAAATDNSVSVREADVVPWQTSIAASAAAPAATAAVDGSVQERQRAAAQPQPVASLFEGLQTSSEPSLQPEPQAAPASNAVSDPPAQGSLAESIALVASAAADSNPTARGQPLLAAETHSPSTAPQHPTSDTTSSSPPPVQVMTEQPAASFVSGHAAIEDHQAGDDVPVALSPTPAPPPPTASEVLTPAAREAPALTPSQLLFAECLVPVHIPAAAALVQQPLNDANTAAATSTPAHSQAAAAAASQETTPASTTPEAASSSANGHAPASAPPAAVAGSTAVQSRPATIEPAAAVESAAAAAAAATASSASAEAAGAAATPVTPPVDDAVPASSTPASGKPAPSAKSGGGGGGKKGKGKRK
ncbi:MAG: hypothetical protein WDW36_004238 [Sanguina aurantia]